MAKSINKKVSVNEVKNVKAVQVISNIQAFRLIAEMKQHLQSAGGLKSIMELTKNFAYSLSEIKPTDDAIPAVKVGKKSFYISPVGAVNECNILNVVKSVLKIEDAKRILAKKLAKRLNYASFVETKDVQEKIDAFCEGLSVAGIDENISGGMVAKFCHRLYNEYLLSLGLDE